MGTTSSRRSAAILTAVFIASISMSGCRWVLDLFGFGDRPEKEKPGVLVVGPSGATLSLAGDGGAPLVSLAIPAGALGASTRIAVSAVASTDSALGPVLKLEPAGQRFEQPVIITVDCGALVASSGLSLDQLGLYCIGDDLALYPLGIARADPVAMTLEARILHFSGIVAAPVDLSSAASAALAAAASSAFGSDSAAYAPPASSVGEAVKSTFSAAFSDPMSQASFDSACSAVKAWCLERAELKPGSSWLIGVSGGAAKEDMVVGGFCLNIESYAGTLPGGDAIEEHANFSYNHVGPQGEYPAGQLFCGVEWSQEESIVAPQSGSREGIVIVYILVEYYASRAVLAFDPPDPLPVAAGETRTTGIKLSTKYYPIDAENLVEIPLPNELIDFEVEGSGSLVSSQATTDAEGKAAVSYTAAWASSEVDGETATLKAIKERVSANLEKSLSISETYSLVQATTPFDEQPDVPVDSIVSIRFREEMDTATVTVAASPSFDYENIWSEGSTLLSLDPTADLPNSTVFTVTVSAGATSLAGAILDMDYSFSFTTADVPVLVVSTNSIEGQTWNSVTYGAGGILSSSEYKFVEGSYYYSGTTLYRYKLFWHEDISDPLDGILDDVSYHETNDGTQVIPEGIPVADNMPAAGSISVNPYKKVQGEPLDLVGHYESFHEGRGDCTGVWVFDLGETDYPFYDDSQWHYLDIYADGTYSLRHVRVHLPAGTDRPDWDGTITGTWTSERNVRTRSDGSLYAFDRLWLTEQTSTMPAAQRDFVLDRVSTYDIVWMNFGGSYFIWNWFW